MVNFLVFVACTDLKLECFDGMQGPAPKRFCDVKSPSSSATTDSSSPKTNSRLYDDDQDVDADIGDAYGSDDDVDVELDTVDGSDDDAISEAFN